MDRPQIGLCLSGGGFRASFYGLGVLRYLAEAGLLKDVVAVSAVSGGSIAATALADRADIVATSGATAEAFLREVDGPFRAVVTEHNLRNQWLVDSTLARARGRRVGRGVVLGELLGSRLYRTNEVTDLPSGVQVILTTTDLTTGRAFRICRDFIGNWDFGYADTPKGIGVGFAAAASAAVPALFPPASLPTAGLGLRNAPKTLSLVDGGVYDNLGLEWFQGWRSGRPTSARTADFLVVANAGGLLHRGMHPYGGLRGLWRAKDVQYSQTTKLRVRWYVNELLASRLRGVYTAIELDPRRFRRPDNTPIDPNLYQAALPSDLVAPLAGLRTDLDRFLPEEAALLSYHAYWSIHARIASLHPQLAVSTPAWRDYEKLQPTELESLLRLLRGGAKRIRRPRRLPRRR